MVRAKYVENCIRDTAEGDADLYERHDAFISRKNNTPEALEVEETAPAFCSTSSWKVETPSSWLLFAMIKRECPCGSTRHSSSCLAKKLKFFRRHAGHKILQRRNKYERTQVQEKDQKVIAAHDEDITKKSSNKYTYLLDWRVIVIEPRLVFLLVPFWRRFWWWF